MTYFESGDRELIGRALDAMKSLALDELYSEEAEYMYSYNTAFIAAALEGLTNENIRDMPAVTSAFSEEEVAELDRITRQFLEAAKTDRQ
jgi:hypothetical protein